MRRHVSGVLDELCKMAGLLLALFVAELLFVVVLLPAVFFLEPGSGSRVVWALDVVGLLVLASFTGVLLLVCYHR